MKDTTREIMLLAMAIFPLILVAVFWNQIPETIPLHWNASGEVDRFGSRFNLIWLCGGVLGIGLYLLFKYIPKIDPRKTNHEKFNKTYQFLRIVFALVFLSINSVIVFTAAGFDINSFKITLIALNSLFVLLGNYLPKMRSNYMIGIRTPWTLENETVWRKTHQTGGKVLFYAALAGLMLAITLPNEYAIVSIFINLAAILFSGVLSYYYYHQEKNAGSATSIKEKE